MKPLLFLLLLLFFQCSEKKSEHRIYTEKKIQGSTSTGLVAPFLLDSLKKSFEWEVPPHWKLSAVKSGRVASYNTFLDNKFADISLTFFPGNVGEVSSNIQRWANQIGLIITGPEDLLAIQNQMDTLTLTEDNKAYLIDFTKVLSSSIYSEETMLVALVPHPSGKFFFKIQGPLPVIRQERIHFLHWLNTFKPKNSMGQFS